MSVLYITQWLYDLSNLVRTLSKDTLAVISDLNLRDEYASLEPKALLREVAKILAKNEVKAILLVDKSQREVVGIMTEQRFLQACATGADPAKTTASKFMSTNVLRLLSDTPIQTARNLIDKHQPDLIVPEIEELFTGLIVFFIIIVLFFVLHARDKINTEIIINLVLKFFIKQI